jgi:hypothetical protein
MPTSSAVNQLAFTGLSRTKRDESAGDQPAGVEQSVELASVSLSQPERRPALGAEADPVIRLDAEPRTPTRNYLARAVRHGALFGGSAGRDDRRLVSSVVFAGANASLLHLSTIQLELVFVPPVVAIWLVFLALTRKIERQSSLPARV